MYYTVTYHDGDTVSSRINATEQEVLDLFPVGVWHNVGDGPRNCYKQIASVSVNE